MATCECQKYDDDVLRLTAFSYDPIFSLNLINPEVMDEHPEANLIDWQYDPETETISYHAEPERAKQKRIFELKDALKETDYYASQCLEDLFEAIGEVEPTDLFASLKILKAIVRWNLNVLTKFGNMIQRRKDWRAELKELEPDE